MKGICLQVRDMKISSHERDLARVDTYKTEAKKTIYKNSSTRKYRTQHCDHCGSARVHSDMKDCPTYGKRCNKCRESKHFAAENLMDKCEPPQTDVAGGENKLGG